MVQSHARRVIAVSGPALLVFLFACGRPTPENEVTRHGDDVLASGSAPQVTDSVPGDAILTGGDMRFSGVTAGDYLGAGGEQMVNGRIHGSIRAAGGEIHVAATVDRNVTIAGGTIMVDRTAIIGRNAYLAGGTIQFDGAVHGALQAAGGTVTLNGVVGHDVEVAAGTLRVVPHAEIAGKLRYRVPEGKVHIDPAARISGTVTALPIPRGRGAWYLLGVLWMFGFLVTGAVVVVLVPPFVTGAAESLRERPGRSALVGLGWIVAMPVAILVAAVTIVGLPLALLSAVVYVSLLYIGRVALAVWLGRRVLGARARTSRSGVLASFGVGGLILLLVRMVPVIGPLTMMLATVLGLGAFLLQAGVVRSRLLR